MRKNIFRDALFLYPLADEDEDLLWSIPTPLRLFGGSRAVIIEAVRLNLTQQPKGVLHIIE